MKDTNAQTLNTFEIGRRGVVVSVRGKNGLQTRLLSMGLRVGDEIRVLHQGEDATPMLIAVGETRLALGRDMAKQILLIPLVDDGHSCKPLRARLRHYFKKGHHGGHHEKKFGRSRGGQHGKNCRVREGELGVS